MYEEAAVVLFELATRHPFSDGNKRTAWVVAAVHLNRRGVTVVAEQSEVVELVVDVVCHRISSSDLTLWFVNHSSRL
ncbi:MULTISPECIES: type II toxin-antitoxin system death-on-curing family toxin [Corynebacterium]|uniref:type II toxin-antitoxin system death-on-curing family toxin n=1 Tax=Corynebacterium TaxID=1716 RepID=UPI001C8F6BE0|nr:Fic family protein [Corynebacterium parakroppenstedtii]